MAEKIGVYFDESAIGPYLSVEDLAENVRNRWGDNCPVIETSPILAGEEGRAMI